MSGQPAKDQQIIRKYLDQPDRLPAELRQQIERAWGGEPVQLYALIDLDAALRLTQSWLVLGPEHLAVARPNGKAWKLNTFRRDQVQAVHETAGLSGSSLAFLGEPDEPAMAVVRFTQRQRRAVENVRFLVEQEVEAREAGQKTPPATEESDPDERYARSVAAPVRVLPHPRPERINQMK